MKKSFLILLLFASFGSAFGKDVFQFKPVYNYETAALKKQLISAKTDTEKLNLLFSLAFKNNMLVESPGYIDTGYLSQIIAINERTKLFDDQPFRTLQQALRKGTKGDFAAELPLLTTAVDQFDEQKTDIVMLLIATRWIFNAADQQEAKYRFYTKKLNNYLQTGQYNNAAACYHCLAGYYVFKGDYNSSINSYLKAGDLFKSFSNLWYVHEFIIVAGRYGDWGNPAKENDYMRQAQKLQTALGINDQTFNILMATAASEYNVKHYKASLACVEKIAEDTAYLFAQSSNITLKALDLIGLNRLEEARNELNKIKADTGRSTLARAIMSGTYQPDYAFYKYYLAVKDLPKAEAFLLNTYEKAQKDADVDAEVVYLKELAQFYGDQKKTDKAWQYTILYNLANDSLRTRTNSFNIASYENEQKENEQNKKMIALRQQRAVQDATLAQRNIIIWLSLAGLLLVLGSLAFIYRQLQINKRNLAHLKVTQNQLIQSEKMASLGELTAGIAHEIQNPLNFVNNFSDVNQEMLEELKAESAKPKAERDDQLEIELITDLIENEQKINHHGKRADAIVKGMLQHSRSSSGQKEPTDLNALAEEYLRLAYHGLRAKDKSFNAELVTHFDKKLPKANLVPQDIGRVILNIINNAFYATLQKAKAAGPDYKPTVEIITSAKNSEVEISIRDNGNGIPENIREKIMQPFFTTKPTGEGTGLGLSLSYDIVVKGHGGTITVDTKEGEYTKFTVLLPIS